jgi:hypothetical protein
MQEALDELNMWSHTSGLQFSIKKTKAMHFTYSTKRAPHPLSFNGEVVEFVSSYKFLGMTFDRRLTWGKHIQGLVDRCQKDLRLLRVLAHCNWGADLTVLRQLYLALLRPKLEYGDILLTTASATLLKKLNRIQYKAARIILGALRCTTVNSLEAEAHLIPLHILRKQHTAAYGGRTLSVQNHPVANLLRQEPYPPEVALPHRPPPVITRIQHELQSMNITSNQIPPMMLKDKLDSYDPPCYYNLKISAKRDLSSRQWQQQFKILITDKYENWTHIYCDGSVSDTAAGSGVWSEEFKLMSRLQPSVSTLTAKMFSIYIALPLYK